MANMEFDLDSNGGLMNQILALTAPPGSRDRSDSANGASSSAEPVSSLSAHPYFKRPGRGHNRDCCDACGEGGDLICCDICPASFHLICHDPPIHEEDIPVGEWGCFQCQVTNMEEDRGSGTSRNGIANLKLNRGVKRKERDDSSSKSGGKGETSNKNSKRDKCDTASADSSTNSGAVTRVLVNGHEMVVTNSPLRVLVCHVATSNPKEFVLPYKHTVSIAFPGESKSIFRHNGRRGAPFKKKTVNDNGISLPAKLCFTCSKGYRGGALLGCDYCPLMFHLDCLDPPLTIAPTHRWMCPNHPEQFMDERRLTSCRVSERVKLWDRCRGLVDQVAVQRSFFNLMHRRRPPSRYKIKRALRKAIRVPEAVKEAYRNPVPLLPALPPAHLRPPVLSTAPLQYGASHLYELCKAPDTSAAELKTRESSRESSPSEARRASTPSCSVAASSATAKEDSSKDASNFSISSTCQSTNTTSQSTSTTSQSTSTTSHSTSTTSQSTCTTSQSMQSMSQSTNTTSQSTSTASQSIQSMSQSTNTTCHSISNTCLPTDTALQSTITTHQSTNTTCQSTNITCQSTHSICQSSSPTFQSTLSSCQSKITVSQSTDSPINSTSTTCLSTNTTCFLTSTNCSPTSTTCSSTLACFSTSTICSSTITTCSSTNTSCSSAHTTCPSTSTPCSSTNSACSAATTTNSSMSATISTTDTSSLAANTANHSTSTPSQSEQDDVVSSEGPLSSCSPASVGGGAGHCTNSDSPKRKMAVLIKESCDRMDEDIEADTTLDSSSQISEDVESQKEISTEEDEEENSHDPEFHVGRALNSLQTIVPEVSPEDSDTESFTSSAKGKSLKLGSIGEENSIESCLLKQCDDKVLEENKFKRIKIDDGMQGFIQSNGDISDSWSSLIDEQFENNNKIVPKRKADCKIDNSCNKVISNPNENHTEKTDVFVRSLSLPLQTQVVGSEEMEVVSEEPVPSVQSVESKSSAVSSCISSPILVKSNYLPSSIVTGSSLNVGRDGRDIKLAVAANVCETRVTSARSDSSVLWDGARLPILSEKRPDAAARLALPSGALASPNPDWPSPIVDISDDSSTSERPLLVDCFEESSKQSPEVECNSSSPCKILPMNKNCFGPSKPYYNNHIVSSQLRNTLITYSKSYQVFNSYPSSSCSSRDLTVEQNNFIESKACSTQTPTVVPHSIRSQAPTSPSVQLPDDVVKVSVKEKTEKAMNINTETCLPVPDLPPAKPTKEEIDVWLSSLVSFQSSVARMVLLNEPTSQPPTSSRVPTTTRTTARTTSSSSCCCSSSTSRSSDAPLKVTNTAPVTVSTRVSCLSEASAVSISPCLPKPSSVTTVSHPTTLPSTPRAGRKQVLIPRTSPTGSSSSSPPFFLPPSSTGTSQISKSNFSASSSAARTPAKTYIARVSSSVNNSTSSSSGGGGAPDSRALCLSDLLHETLHSLQTKLHAAHAAKHSELNSLDQNLVELLAMQRLEQLQQAPTVPPPPPLYTAPALPAHALLCPLVEPPSVQPAWVDLQVPSPDAAPPVPMQYRLLSVGKGSHNNVDLERYGHCNYVASDHACIVLDEYSGQYELVNYSSDGSVVDGAVYRCDLSGQKSVISPPQSSTLQQQVRDCIQKYRESYNKHGAPGYRFSLSEDADSKAEVSSPSVGARSLGRQDEPVMTSRSDQVIRRCGCPRSSGDDRSQGGWEGPAVLRHGSFIKFGCLKFVFSIVETASTGNWRAVTEEAYAKFYERECRERREEEEAAAAAAKSKEKDANRSSKHGKEKSKDKDVICDGGKEGTHKETLEKERKKESKKSKKDKEGKKERENKSKS